MPASRPAFPNRAVADLVADIAPLGATGLGNRIDLDGNGTTTFGSGITVRAQNGTIGQQLNIGGTQTLVNQATISANVAGGTVTMTRRSEHEQPQGRV